MLVLALPAHVVVVDDDDDDGDGFLGAQALSRVRYAMLNDGTGERIASIAQSVEHTE